MALALVTTAGFGNSSSSTTVASPATAHTSGSLLVVVVNWETAATNLSSMADTAGNTYSNLTKRTSTNMGSQIWYCANITGNASNIVTATFSSATTGHSIMVHEFSGAAVSSVFDQENGTSGTGSSLSAGNVTTTQADEVLVAGFVRWNSGGVWTEGSSYTMGANTSAINTGYMPSMMEYRIVSATGTYDGNATNTGGGEYLAVVASFKAQLSNITPGVGGQSMTGNQSILGTGLIPGTMIAGT